MMERWFTISVGWSWPHLCPQNLQLHKEQFPQKIPENWLSNSSHQPNEEKGHTRVGEKQRPNLAIKACSREGTHTPRASPWDVKYLYPKPGTQNFKTFTERWTLKHLALKTRNTTVLRQTEKWPLKGSHVNSSQSQGRSSHWKSTQIFYERDSFANLKVLQEE